jgi:hypothetical protein
MAYIVESLVAFFYILFMVALVILAAVASVMFISWEFFIPTTYMLLSLTRLSIVATVILLALYINSNDFKLAVYERQSR